MDENALRRRTVMKLAGGGAATALAGSVAGCSSIPFLGGGGSASYGSWAPEPDELEQDNYAVGFLDLKTVTGSEDTFSDSFYGRQQSQYENTFGITGLDYEDDAREYFTIGNVAQVLSANLDREDVIDDVTSEGPFDDGDEMGGFTLIEPDNENVGRAFAVSGSKVIRTRAFADLDAIEIVELLIETSNGEVDRYRSEDDAFRKATSMVSGTDYNLAAGVEETDSDVVATGGGASFNGDTTRVELGYVFEDAEARDDAQSDFEDLQEQAEEGDTENVNFSAGGRTIELSFDVDTDEFTASTLLFFLIGLGGG